MFGSEYSTNSEGDFNEGSNELLYEIVTTANEAGNYDLKDKMIHVLSNVSALKAGATNVNSSSYWTSGNPLAYATFKNRFIGPQLDASHEADQSEIKEITQVISALAQNSDTGELSEEAYKDIADVIKNAMSPIMKRIDPNPVRVVVNGIEEWKTPDKKELYDYMSKKFVNTILHSKGDNIAKVLVQSFKEDEKIPFSNQNFFVQFVRDIITRMNNDFITRYYSGIGGILIPSHGIIKVLDFNGSPVTYEDLSKIALSGENDPNLSNDEIIANFIAQNFSDVEGFDADAVQLGDTVKIDNRITQLDTPRKYYDFKKKYSGQFVTLSRNIARDLKPTEIT